LTAPVVAGAPSGGCGAAEGDAKVGGATLVPVGDNVSPTAVEPAAGAAGSATFGMVDTVPVGATTTAPALPASG
jgi:hypothetical protein